MRLPRILVPPDDSLPNTYSVLLAVLGLLALAQSLLLFGFSYFFWDFGPFCLGAAVWGAASLVINLLTYRACRRLYSKHLLSPSAALFTSSGMMIVNGLALILGLIALTAGAVVGAANNPWLEDITSLDFIVGSVAMVLIFYPFNALGVAGGLALRIIMGRGTTVTEI